MRSLKSEAVHLGPYDHRTFLTYSRLENLFMTFSESQGCETKTINHEILPSIRLRNEK